VVARSASLQREYLDDVWDRADFELDGDAALQQAVRENGKAHARAGGRRVVAHRRSCRGSSSGNISSDQATSSRCDGLRVTGTAPCRVDA
jgi:hypothetical protein